MIYPTIAVRSSARSVISTFRGYNHNMRIGDGELYDMVNLTSDQYPLLSPRKQRGFYTGGADITGIISKDMLCYTDGTAILIGRDRVDLGLTGGDKTLVSMGAYVIVFPDKKYINTVDLNDRGSLEVSFTTTEAVRFTLCNLTSEPYAVTHTASAAPADLKAIWLDTGSTPHSLKRYSTATGQWVSVGTTYIRLESQGIGASFEKGDGVTISGLKEGDLIDNVTGKPVEDSTIRAIDGAFTILDRGEDYVLITGILDHTRVLRNAVTLERKVPQLDLCIESGNRLWGCRYGVDEDGKTVNEIYASKLGDFKNWNCFQGVSTDSYAASCGSDGPFTGAIAHMGYPLFFKEGCLHKVYGTQPSNFQIQTTPCRGVQKGSSRSLAIVGEVLYYKSRLGVCAYDGSLPVDIGQAFGDIAYDKAVAGAHGSKYCVSMADGTGVYHLFVYDAARNLWHKEDNTQAKAFCSWENDLYYLDAADGQIKTIYGSGARSQTPVRWMAQTGLWGVDDPDKKYISRVQIRIQLEPESTVNVYIDYDSADSWEYVCTMKGVSLRSFDIPIQPRRCDHFRLRIQGDGQAKIFSITKTLTGGGQR